MSYLRILKKTFEPLTQKKTKKKKKNLVKRDRERNRTERQRIVKKVDLILICFKILKFDWSGGIEK